MLLISLLFSVVGFYLTLIAKFYRMKFSKGPPHRYLQMALAVLVAGLVLRLDFIHLLPTSIADGIICAGGLAFSGLGYALYRTMMSVD
jgi:uncharacterized membrane protein YoaK (UPF0700 family)